MRSAAAKPRDEAERDKPAKNARDKADTRNVSLMTWIATSHCGRVECLDHVKDRHVRGGHGEHLEHDLRDPISRIAKRERRKKSR